MTWVTAVRYIETDEPELTTIPAPTDSFGHNVYTSTDFCLDFEQWLNSVGKDAFYIVYAYACGRKVVDIAKDIHASHPYVSKMLAKLQEAYNSEVDGRYTSVYDDGGESVYTLSPSSVY